MEATQGHLFSHKLFSIWVLLLELKVPVLLGQEVLERALQRVTHTQFGDIREKLVHDDTVLI